jgi:hypothetical protein
MSQVIRSIESPVGSGAEVEQSEISAPRLFNDVGVIDIGTPTVPPVPVAPT